MFKSNEPPVSLFSFQDIITTLTGIMIFFLLILVISLFEIAENSPQDQSAPVYTEWREIQKQNILLRRQISEISQDIKKYRQRLQQLAEQDEGALTLEKRRLQEQLALKTEKLNTLRKKLADLEHQLYVEDKRRQDAAARKQQLAAEQQEIRKAQQALPELQNRIHALKKEIIKRQKVNITLDRNISERPLLIECSRALIKIVDPRTNTVKEFKLRTPAASDMIVEVIDYLKTLPVYKYYFVFLIRPSAAGYMDFLHTKLETKAIPGAKYGIEPILESEEYF